MATTPDASGSSAMSEPKGPVDDPVKLRSTLLALTYECPRGCYTRNCPFKQLQGLSHPTRQVVFERLSYNELVGLFDLATACRCPADPRGNPPAGHCLHSPAIPLA